jgi:hypothetical protein
MAPEPLAAAVRAAAGEVSRLAAVNVVAPRRNLRQNGRNTHMRTAALFAAAGLTLAALPTAAPAPAQGAAPYPPSTAITGLAWDTGTYRYGGVGGDIWPITWHGDGTLRSAYGDGNVGCPYKVSYGVVSIASATPSTALQKVSCGPQGSNKGKLMTLGSSGSALYTQLAPQSTGSGFPVMRSTDGGQTWTRGFTPSWLASSYVGFGQGAANVRDGYIYLLEDAGNSVRLGRVQPGSWNVSTAYQWFSGTATAPAWTSSKGSAKPIFTDPAGLRKPTMSWVPGLGRYLLIAAHETPGKVGIFESPNMWGPWRTVYYTENWLGLGNAGLYYSIYLPVKWMSADGRTLWATFSCHNGPDTSAPGGCGKYHDRLNLMRVTLR